MTYTGEIRERKKMGRTKKCTNVCNNKFPHLKKKEKRKTKLFPCRFSSLPCQFQWTQVQISPNFIEIYTIQSKFILLLGQGISLNVHNEINSNYSSLFSEVLFFPLRLWCPCQWGFVGVRPFPSSWVFPELTTHLRLRR